jgi:hypothetical protein
MDATTRFLTAILGTRGAEALTTLSKSSDDVQAVLVPRALLAWLRGFDAVTSIPGVPEIEVVLQRSEAAYTGAVVTPEFYCELEDASLARVAAVLAHAIGAPIAPGLPRDVDLARFGATVDRLVKAQAHKEPVEGRGSVAAAIAPTPPAAPTAVAPPTNKPGATAPAKFKLPKIAAKAPGAKPLKLSEADTGRKCSVCDTSQFVNGKFKGCYCIRGMVKHIPAERTVEGWTIKLDRLSEDEASMVIELFKGAIDGSR